MARTLPDDDPELKEAKKNADQAVGVYFRRRHIRNLEAAIEALKADWLAHTGTPCPGDLDRALRPAALQPTDA